MHHQRMDIPPCPFCPFSDTDLQFVAEHIEFCHPENGTPDAEHGGSTIEQRETAPWGDEGKYLNCPHGCGEVIVDAELPTHMDLHFAEEVANEETGFPKIEARSEGPDAYRFDEFPGDDNDLDAYEHLKKKGRSGQKKGPLRETSQKGSTIAHSPPPKTTMAGGVKRLGRAELGPHAHEKRMPPWLLRMLEKGPKMTQSNKISSDGKLLKHETVENETAHIVPVLSRLCEQDTSVQRAFLCSSKVHHVFKMPREGGFCGYRNIQMLISYIQGSQSPGYENFSKGLPTIIELQDMIEHAWDMGFNSVGKVETGGIRGTRKYIGTPEAQALFTSLGIQCEANSIAETKDVRAHDALYMNVAAYFRPACSLEKDDKVIKTELPPIYFQHQGHSLTIIGFEIRDSGSANILVFDPMFKTSPAIKRLIGTNVKSSEPARLLKAYRRGSAYLQKYKIFEILKLPVPTTSFSSAEE